MFLIKFKFLYLYLIKIYFYLVIIFLIISLQNIKILKFLKFWLSNDKHRGDGTKSWTWPFGTKFIQAPPPSSLTSLSFIPAWFFEKFPFIKFHFIKFPFIKFHFIKFPFIKSLFIKSPFIRFLFDKISFWKLPWQVDVNIVVIDPPGFFSNKK